MKVNLDKKKAKSQELLCLTPKIDLERCTLDAAFPLYIVDDNVCSSPYNQQVTIFSKRVFTFSLGIKR